MGKKKYFDNFFETVKKYGNPSTTIKRWEKAVRLLEKGGKQIPSYYKNRRVTRKEEISMLKDWINEFQKRKLLDDVERDCVKLKKQGQLTEYGEGQLDLIKRMKWLNSKGHSIIKVKCASCSKLHEAVIDNVRKRKALKDDTFFCCSKCGSNYFKKRVV